MTAADYHCTAGAKSVLAQATKLWVRKKNGGLRQTGCVVTAQIDSQFPAEDRQKSLCLGGRHEAFHAALALTGWLMRISRAVIGTFASGVLRIRENIRTWLDVAGQFVCHDFPWGMAGSAQQFLEIRAVASLFRLGCTKLSSTLRSAIITSTSRKIDPKRKNCQTHWLMTSAG